MESESWAQHVLTESLALNELGHEGGGGGGVTKWKARAGHSMIVLT